MQRLGFVVWWKEDERKMGFRVLNRFGDFKERRRFYQVTTVIDIVN